MRKEHVERLADSLNYLDPALVEELEAPARARRPAPARVLMAAACIAALLVVGVVAVEIVSSGAIKIYRTEGENGGTWFFFGNYGDVGEIPAEELSPELLALADQYRDEAFHLKHLSFDTWEEAEAFLGRSIMDNPLLAGGGYRPNGVTYEGEHIEGNCIVSVVTDYGVIRYVVVDARYSLEQGGSWASPWVTVRASVYVEQSFEGTPLESAINTEKQNPEEPPLECTINTEMPTTEGQASYTDNYEEVKEQEAYRMANGFEAVIFDMICARRNLDGSITYDDGFYDAYFFRPGIRIEVSRYYSEENKETALEELKQVLDAFE